MKTVTVGQARARLPDLLRLVDLGQQIRIVRRRQPVARIVPDSPSTGAVDWSETWSKVDAIFGGKPVAGKPGSEIIREGRR